MSATTEKTGRCTVCQKPIRPQYALCFFHYVEREIEEAYHRGYMDGMRDTREAMAREGTS